MPNHFIIRVGDGKNFKNSKMSFWGINSGKNDSVKSLIKKNIEKGDIIWFLTNKLYGGKFIGVAEYIDILDKRDEELIQINTYSNNDQNWIGDEKWNIQLHYKNLYEIEHCNIKFCTVCASSILVYSTFKKRTINQTLLDLETHYENICNYTKLSNKFNI